MAGRIQYPYDPYNNHHGYSPNGPPTRPMPPHPLMLEEQLEIQHHEIRRLLGENRRLVEDRIGLQQELVAAREEFRQMNIEVTEIQKENEMYSRQLSETVLKLEADVWATEPLKNDILQLHDDVKRFDAINLDLYGKVQTLKKEVAKLQAENNQLPSLREEFEELYKELLHARDAIGYEKKINCELLDQKQTMEKDLVSMEREVEMLRADLFHPDARWWGPDGSHMMNFGNYQSSYLHPYGSHQMGAAENGPFYGSGSTPRAELDKSQMTGG